MKDRGISDLEYLLEQISILDKHIREEDGGEIDVPTIIFMIEKMIIANRKHKDEFFSAAMHASKLIRVKE